MKHFVNNEGKRFKTITEALESVNRTYDDFLTAKKGCLNPVYDVLNHGFGITIETDPEDASVYWDFIYVRDFNEKTIAHAMDSYILEIGNEYSEMKDPICTILKHNDLFKTEFQKEVEFQLSLLKMNLLEDFWQCNFATLSDLSDKTILECIRRNLGEEMEFDMFTMFKESDVSDELLCDVLYVINEALGKYGSSEEEDDEEE